MKEAMSRDGSKIIGEVESSSRLGGGEINFNMSFRDRFRGDVNVNESWTSKS